MRPDRAVVIGHRIVARFAARHRADAPAGEEVGPQQALRDQRGARRIGDAASGEPGRHSRCAPRRAAWRRRAPARTSRFPGTRRRPRIARQVCLLGHQACRPRVYARCGARNKPPCAWRRRRSPALPRARWRLRPIVRRHGRPRRSNPSSPDWRDPARSRANIRQSRRHRDRPGHRSNRARRGSPATVQRWFRRRRCVPDKDPRAERRAVSSSTLP